jgi:ubiquinol-cytochrome c reductase iron-sulfur subunit
MPKHAAVRIALLPVCEKKEQPMSSATESSEPTRRDFIFIATGAMAVVGTAAALWPFIAQMNPDASVLALSTIEVDINPLAEGQGITVKWRGNPVFLRHRTKKEIEEARSTPLEELKDRLARNENLPDDAPATDENRSAKDTPKYLLMMGVCTHLGCVPLGEAGDYHGWFCPCHGSHYDTAGRIRKGPAPENLPIPKIEFVSDTTVRIG